MGLNQRVLTITDFNNSVMNTMWLTQLCTRRFEIYSEVRQDLVGLCYHRRILLYCLRARIAIVFNRELEIDVDML